MFVTEVIVLLPTHSDQEVKFYGQSVDSRHVDLFGLDLGCYLMNITLTRLHVGMSEAKSHKKRGGGLLKEVTQPVLTLSIGKYHGVRSALGPLSPAE